MDASLLYLGAQALQALDLTPRAVCDALAEAFARHAASGFTAPPKQTLALGPGHFFQSLSVAAAGQPHAATKWVGIASANAGRGLANVNGLILLSDTDTGEPLAVMDANLLTVMRTAGMSALAARHLARPDSRSIGFIGCGQQARGHLRALRDVLPHLACAVAYSGRLETARAFAADANTLGLAARAVSAPDEVLACDVVVTSVAGGPSLQPFLDARQIRPGGFATAVDLGRSWLPQTLEAFDLKVTDDHAQADDPQNRRKLAYQGRFDADLARLVAAPGSGRTSDAQRILFLFPGFAVADLAIASLAYRTALAAGAGVRLPR